MQTKGCIFMVMVSPSVNKSLDEAAVISNLPGSIFVSLVAQTVKNPPAMRETRARSLGWENPLEKGMATQSSILAWEIPWTVAHEAPLSMGSQRVGHD